MDFPTTEHGYTQNHSFFKEPVCLECKPVDERLRKRAISERVCAGCTVSVAREKFSKTQWAKGSAGKCIPCCEQATLTSGSDKQRKTMKTCCICGTEHPREAYSITQWQQPASQGSVCKGCAEQRLQQSHDKFVLEHVGQGGTGPQAEAEPLWPADANKSCAVRFILEAGVDKLPSTDLKAYQAVQATLGRSDFWTLRMQVTGT